MENRSVNIHLYMFVCIVLVLTIASMYMPRYRAEYVTPIISIPKSIYTKIDGSITSIDIAYDGSHIAVASDTGYLYLLGYDGRILWKTPMRAGISHMQGSINLEYIVAVSKAMELTVYSYNGSLVDYRHRCSRAQTRSLLYLYDRSIVVLLDELGWIYSYAIGRPEGRGEEWILGYSYTVKGYSLSIARFDPSIFTEIYPSKSSQGLTGEAAIAIYARISDNRTGVLSIYDAPLLRFYRFTDTIIENLFQVVLDDMRGYRLDSLELYDTGFSKLILAAGSNPANPDPKARYLIRVYELSEYKLSGFYTIRSFWSYSLGGRCVAVRMDSSGRYIAVVSEDYQLYLFGISAHIVNYLWSISLGYTPSCIALESIPLTIAVGVSDGWVYMIDEVGDLLWRSPLSLSKATSIDLSNLGYRLAVGFSDGSLAILSDARLKKRILDVSLTDPTGVSITGANLTIAGMGMEIYTTTPSRLLLPVGSYTIVVDHIDIGKASIDIRLASDLCLEVDSRILVQPMYPLIFNVYDERSIDIKPESYRVEVEGRLGFNVSTTLTPVNPILVLPRDTYNVKVYADHYKSYNATVRLTSSVNLSIPLTPEYYRLALTVGSWLDEFIGRASVELWWMDKLYGYTYTSARGEAVFTAPYGDYILKIQANHYNPKAIPIRLTDDTVTIISLDPTIYTLTASIKGYDGTPLFGSVRIYRAGKLYSEASFTDGLLRAPLPYGSYRFEFISSGWRRYSVDLVIPDKLSLEAILQPETYTLTITVVDDVDKPLEGARITISGPESLASYTDSYGIFRRELIRGRYTVTVSMDGYKPTTTYIDLSESKQILLRLQPEFITILWRYLPYILLLAVIPIGSLLTIIFYLRRRRMRELEEVSEEELRELGVGS
ncbi:carboxypeptidase regulatory-like domain-containing protein [Candidatus Bathyarchaeota archaeon]|nr:carboxypeptidase regulatory-like domain-containing protein [Candidatus Bathyarchaeota archaeon]